MHSVLSALGSAGVSDLVPCKTVKDFCKVSLTPSPCDAIVFNKERTELFAGDTQQETVRHQTGIDRHRPKDIIRLSNKQTNGNPQTTK